VSSKRDKLIEEAQRMTARGQLDKAVKAYEQLLALDPSAINQRQKLAELLVKTGRSDEARAEFFTIGNYYASNGFYLKAIAVFKKLQVMFPADIEITLNLARLNEKHGLAANALAEYKQVYEYFEKVANQEEALKILEKMQNVDMQNIGIRLKLAEAYFKAGKKDLSYAAFGRLATLLQERGDNAACNRINTRIQQLFPEKSEFMLEVLTEQVLGGKAASALNALQALLRSNPHDKRIWNLIVAAYRKTGQQQRLKAAYQLFIKFFPDELSARTGLAECLAAERDVTGTLECLEAFPPDLVDRQVAAGLVAVYQALELIDPVNIRILEGLQRAYLAAGDETAAANLDVKLSSLLSLSRGQGTGQPAGQADRKTAAQPEAGEQKSVGQPLTEAVYEAESVADAGAGQRSDLAVKPVEVLDLSGGDEDEIEIEVEVDEEGDFGELGPLELPAEETGEDWLNSVGRVFDAITTAPRSVKFGIDLDTSDAQSHYDLGVAFKEMGLYDEAISEFRHAAGDPARKVECLALQGACLREKGDVVTAESALRSLLKPGLALNDLCSIKYELALTCEAAFKGDEAAALLEEIDQACPGFRDVRSRLDAAGSEPTLDFSDEDLQGFELN